MQKTVQKQAFTLVELIVVITILAILGTIAFISLQGYSANARDSVRISNLTNMDKGLATLVVKDGNLPDPQGSVANITVNGSTIMTQGEMTQTMAEQHLKMSGDIVDPVDQSNPIYTLSSDKKKFQIALFLEAENLALSQQAHAADGKTFITKGNKLGIVLDDNETPVNQKTGAPATLELTTTTVNHKIYLDDTELVEGIGSTLAVINPVSSCKRILEVGGARSANGGDGVYTINPAGTEFQVYCDMITDGGGWTLMMMNREEIGSASSAIGTGVSSSAVTLPNYDNWTKEELNDSVDLGSVNNVMTKAVESVEFAEMRFECLGDQCIEDNTFSIYEDSESSILSQKSGDLNLKSQTGWPFDYFRMYESGGNHANPKVPFDKIQIDPQCAPDSNRPYEACVQIGLVGLDYYSFQNSIGVGVYGKEWYAESLEINAPFGYIGHRHYVNLKMNLWIR